MPGDADFNRLKADQDRAFQRKQDAWQEQDRAWQRRQAARDTLDRAHQRKQGAYERQQEAWEELQRVRDRNGPRIDRLNDQQETAYQNMKDAFDRASDAHDSRDGAAARMYADDGHRYKAETQEAVAERRQLVQEIRDAKARHEAIRPDFQSAKAEFDRAKSEHDRARSDHERAQADFKRTKSDFEGAKKAFQAYLAAAQAQKRQRKDDKRSLAERAGVPYQYLDDVYVSTEPDGTVNIYFGGFGSPDGPGHGHYAMDSRGNVTYSRDPSDDHGAHNFADYEERAQRPYFESQYHDDGKAAGLTYGGDRSFESPIHATDEEGRDITVSFGRNGTRYEGQTLIADGHLTADEFYKTVGHDHAHPSDRRHGGYTDRGKYSGNQ